jgi:2-keto-4-pentenoate hydratase/2-oxohepta-3-ene-1,7-dioic acid hydratase in catechol pathway
VIVGREGYDIRESDAMSHVAGYTVANDLTARTLQGDDRKLKYPWFRSKNLEGFCPLGPCLVPRDALEVTNLRVTARVFQRGGSPDGELRQDANTRDLIVSVPQAIAWLSRHLTLKRAT